MSQKRIKRERKKERNGIVSSTLPPEADRRNDEKEVWGIRKILKENWKFLAGLCLGVFLLYSNALNGDFVSDDYAAISQNPLVLDVKHMLGNINLTSAGVFFLAKIFGVSSPIPFHFFSLFLYIWLCVMVFIFVYLLFETKVAKWTSVLFAVLPIHTETVSWISGMGYLFVALGVIMSLNLLILYLKKENKKYIYWFVVVTILAFMGERVRALALVFLSFLLLFSYNNKFKQKLPLGKIVMGGLGFLLMFGVVFWPNIMGRINSVNSGYNGSGNLFYDPFFQYPTAMAKYLQMLLVPVDLTLYHTMYIFPVWLNWLILLVYLVNLVYFWFKNRDLFFALAFIFVATAPSMAPVKVSWLMAERYMLLGSVGFCLFLALIFLILAKRYKKVAAGVFLTLMMVYSVRVFLRNINWQTNHNLWVNTCQTSPNSHNAWNNIGDDYDKLGQYENAVKGFTQSTVVKPDYADAYHNRANIFYKTGRLDLARDSYNTALAIAPNLYQTYASLAQIDLNEGKAELAIAHSQKLVELQPNSPQSHYIFGVILARVGLIDKAKEEFRLTLGLDANFKPARDGLRELER